MVSARLVGASQYLILLLTRLAKPETLRSLPLALTTCLKGPFVAAILPRILMILFRFSRPILLKESIKYVAANHDGAADSQGLWFIVSATTIYIGLAVRSFSILFRWMLAGC